ncbi:hypothetical protein IFM89_011092 [Coptis chinensis]|uniref:RRM domain-containing protein n=1 Tax=Coptis chinensis TaxID=261450 RepID=A0A835IQA5_9MAGN|nr:hypothetical protein IFM89_011092 [Coptis chinensis]
MSALKTTTTTQQVFNEDLWCGNGTNGYSSISSQEHDLKTCSDGPSIKNEFGFVPESELIVPEGAAPTPFISTKLMLRKFESKDKGQYVNATSKPKLTLMRPKEPDTKHLAVLSAIGKSWLELEEEMMANIPKFKTGPVNKKLQHCLVHCLKIFIGGLAKDTTLAVFTNYFEKYGGITDLVIMKDRYMGHPRGFGFITYADPSVVDIVIEETHVINGKQVCLFFPFFFVSYCNILTFFVCPTLYFLS